MGAEYRAVSAAAKQQLIEERQTATRRGAEIEPIEREGGEAARDRAD